MRVAMIPTMSAGRLKKRRGLTLVELLIVMVLLSIVVGGIMGVIVRQQRFYSGTATMLDTRGSVEEGLSVLQSELRVLAPSEDIYAPLSRTAIEFRQFVGSAVACAITGQEIIVPPVVLKAGNTLTSWATTPRAGDGVLIYDTKDEGTAIKDHEWRGPGTLSVAPVPGTVGDCPTSTRLVQASDAAPLKITLNQNVMGLSPGGTIKVGAAIRIFRRVRYELYKAADNKWYLGYRACDDIGGGSCDALTPVSGPYLPAAQIGPSGLELTYLQADGVTQASTPSDVARIDVVMRAQSEGDVNMPGRPSGKYVTVDSLKITVRN